MLLGILNCSGLQQKSRALPEKGIYGDPVPSGEERVRCTSKVSVATRTMEVDRTSLYSLA